MASSEIMSYYTPIISSILKSSIVLEDVETRWLWTVLLILADESRESHGVVDTPIERLAQIANLTSEQTRKSLERLCAPDPASKSKVLGGARLVVIGHKEGFEDRQWKIVNWDLYKKRVRQMQVSAAVRRFRERSSSNQEKSTEIKGNQGQSGVNPPSLSPTPTPIDQSGGVKAPGNGAPERPPTRAEINAAHASVGKGIPSGPSKREQAQRRQELKAGLELNEKPFSEWSDDDAAVYLKAFPDHREKLHSALLESRGKGLPEKNP